MSLISSSSSWFCSIMPQGSHFASWTGLLPTRRNYSARDHWLMFWGCFQSICSFYLFEELAMHYETAANVLNIHSLSENGNTHGVRVLRYLYPLLLKVCSSLLLSSFQLRLWQIYRLDYLQHLCKALNALQPLFRTKTFGCFTDGEKKMKRRRQGVVKYIRRVVRPSFMKM